MALWEKIDKFFEKRKKLRKPPKRIELDSKLEHDMDEARALVFTVGSKLGFDELSSERIIEIVGNPFSALKFLVAVAGEARKIASLQEQGLLELPDPANVPLTVSKPKRRTAAGQRRAQPTAEQVRRGIRPRGSGSSEPS